MRFKFAAKAKKPSMFYLVFFLFCFVHVLFSLYLGRLYALAPDEQGYLFAFNNVYQFPINTTAQSGSGWITAPTIFLWIAYLPAKVLEILGFPDYLAIRILSVADTLQNFPEPQF